jgi:type IV secretory pathway ATPase VirB11/archaellum biosynthesis ATPase
VMMIGEIRDHETAEVCLQASLTGHLVLSTLHTNSTVETIKCLSKINFIFAAKIFDHAFYILNKTGKIGISPEFDPFILHETP